jgi:hypothetical protein
MSNDHQLTALAARRSANDLPAAQSAIAELYGLAPRQVEVIPYPPAIAIKIVMDRKLVAGDPGDRDVYGAQQHGPLLGIEI